jgi:hypothetical protein
MSYDLCIWDPEKTGGFPQSEKEALAAAEELGVLQEAHNPKLVEFAGLLARCYALWAAEAKLVGGIATFWGSDPRTTMSGPHCAAYRLKLPQDECIRQIAYAVESAAHLGLVIYDDENGMCFLPDGKILPEYMREIWESDLEDLKAEPSDPASQKSDGRTFWERLGSELLDELSRGS